ncbi:DUF4366 domain-containing protein [Eubacterium sp. OM08-24]|uniref:CD1107 family mobile element protein n=1 Tax=Eubacterium sp. OM08-24 TaxID=2292352 RepID=UPI000E43A6B2|nr:DUF4366 domain-containing protein [Eubacterium sp. OM08-24]RGM21793.1 DUF4366 domain-containing protein [Eubacterium sp. OM08-24]
MNKKKCKISRAISAVVLCVAMLAVSICGANAAEATADDNNDNNTAVEETTAESNENESNSTDYNWSSNTTGNANLTADQEILMENGMYQFIAVKTRDDDTFYVIIDKTKNEDNVYFLNEVDTADIEKFLSDDTNANATVQETTQPATEQVERTATSDDSQFTIYLIVGVIVLGGIAFAIFKLKKGKSTKKNADTSDDDFDDFDYEEINEDNNADNAEDNK